MFFARLILIAIAIIFTMNLCACDKSNNSSQASVQLGHGIVHGHVTFAGNPPPYKEIPLSHGVRDETILVGKDAGLRNVIVYLKDAPKAPLIAKDPAVLDQVNCQYVPHVLAMQAGQTLTLKSSDAVLHNVNMQSQVNPPHNYSFASVGHQDIVMQYAEDPFPIKCDVHVWMKAWIGVFDNPWFAVSINDGSYTIENIPPGKYTLAAWQEVLPEQEQSITVSDDSPVEANFTFQAP